MHFAVIEEKIFISMFLALIVISTSSAADKSKLNKNQICKAGIAKIMGRDPAIIKVDQTKGETVYLSYSSSR
ncbi:MAG: hypothetical protein A6F71_05360 [Cycloclasticus sp. symbiont of Poecilosclerida sp. M]|nr:MAG: hypothetical protein A6F71_05360 [Cycloclasticus sp. symbiont of Poecilosclerida sp. M]